MVTVSELSCIIRPCPSPLVYCTHSLSTFYESHLFSCAMALFIYTDGGSYGNLGPSTITRILCDPFGHDLMHSRMYLPKAINNEVEYTTIIEALTDTLCFHHGPIIMFCGSQIMEP